MKLKKIVLICVLLCCGIAVSQTNNAVKQDSILYYLKNAKGKQQLKYLKRSVDLAAAIQNDSLIRETNIEFGLQSYFKKNTSTLDISQKNLQKLYLRTKDSFALAKVYHYKALIHLLNFKKDSSLYYYVESKNISVLLKDSLEVGRRLLSMSNTQRDGNDDLGSQISSIEGLQYLEPINDYRYSGSLYNNLGLIATRLRNYDEARKYFKKSQEVHKKNPSKRRKEIARHGYFNNYGNTYYREKNYKKAIAYYKEGLKFDSLEVKYPMTFVLLTENLSNNYIEIGEYKKGIEGLKKANRIRKKRNDLRGLSINHNQQFVYYNKIKDSKNALFHGNIALEYAKKTKYVRRELNILYNLYRSNLISTENANIYMRRYIYINDSLLKIERDLKNKFVKIRYETGKKEKENTVLKIENDRKQVQLEQEKQQKIISFLLAIGSLLLLGISFLVFKQRRKKLVFKNKLQKAEAREQERQQIAKSLHDEVAGDLSVLHQQLENSNQVEVANKLDKVKDNVRNLSHKLSSVHFEEVSFKDQMINLISDYYSLDCKILITGLKENNWKQLDNQIKRMLYLSARESLQNAYKHAKATEIKIDLQLDKNNVYLSIEDNGTGFDSRNNTTGIGLRNQRERVEELNGKIEIKSLLTKGTTTKIELPINA